MLIIFFFLKITGCSKDYVIERISKLIVPCKKQDKIAHSKGNINFVTWMTGKILMKSKP